MTAGGAHRVAPGRDGRQDPAAVLWVAGWPIRSLLLLLIGGYRASLGKVIGGRCRFYPSCSEYAETVVRDLGAARGGVLALWRVLRCSPLTRGGIDHPPLPRRAEAVDSTGGGGHGRATTTRPGWSA